MNESGLNLHMRRTLPARRSRVFNALTEPDELAKWWGPNGFTAPGVEVDLRVGGTYRIAMQPPEGALFYLVGEFREVDPPARLSYTFRWEAPDPEDRETIVTLSLEDLGGSTEVNFWQGEFATERRRALHHEGWANSFDRLQEMMSRPPGIGSSLETTKSRSWSSGALG
ncbi:MAG: SRPBCC family protein [Gaiellaceae bacterium]